MSKSCNYCLNDHTVRNMHIYADGRCNYCHAFESRESQLHDYRKLEKLFMQRINAVKGKYDFDAAVGISGGKDSTYVLYKLVNDYGLKVKAFTIDNGFLSAEARKNIEKTVKEFHVEHEFITFDPELLRKVYRYSMKKWLVPCIACSYIGYATMINYTAKINAGLCVHGRGLDQMMRYYDKDTFSILVDEGLKNYEDTDIVSLYNKILESINQKLGRGMRASVEEMLFKDVKRDDFREFVAYFLYHPYDKNEVIKFLEQNTSWRVKAAEKEHYDCEIHNAAKYIYQCAEGRPHSLPELSVQIRNHQITKQEARVILDNQTYTEEPTKELNRLRDYVGLSKRALLTKAKIYRRLPK